MSKQEEWTWPSQYPPRIRILLLSTCINGWPGNSTLYWERILRLKHPWCPKANLAHHIPWEHVVFSVKANPFNRRNWKKEEEKTKRRIVQSTPPYIQAKLAWISVSPIKIMLALAWFGEREAFSPQRPTRLAPPQLVAEHPLHPIRGRALF